MMYFLCNKPILNYRFLLDGGITEKKLLGYFPLYILKPRTFRYGVLKRIIILFVKKILEIGIWIALRPRFGRVGHLDVDEVNKVYTREARSYNIKHHITTRGMDLNWRRSCGFFLSTFTDASKIKILDLCTGTGLTTKEINLILKEYGINAEIVALDYNSEMLSLAKLSKIDVDKSNAVEIKYVRGDAMNLVNNNHRDDGNLVTFNFNTFDVVFQMFGMGGINNPLRVLDQVLKILKPGGYFLMIDIHHPIPAFCGEFPLFFVKWISLPIFESVIYEEATVPLVLNRLWGWRDITLAFYLISLITYRDSNDRFWGFRKRLFDFESQRWWFSLPVMPAAKVVVEKVPVGRDDAEEKEKILELYKKSLAVEKY